jgi:alternate signal-mediated exported protein
MIGGTFAYFSQTSSASNFLSANNYNSTLTEDFTPPQDGNFTPGVEYEKVVGVENTGNVGMLVRISYQEYWNNIAVFTSNTEYADAASVDPDGAGPLSADMYYDTAVDPSDVLKEAGDTALNSNGNWVYGGDGWYYFLAELQPEDSTDSFIDSIMLKNSTLTSVTSYDVIFWNEETEMYTTVATYADQAAIDAALELLPTGSYVSSKVGNTAFTMANTGSYELKFTVETVQSVSEAATIWKSSATVAGVDTFLDGFIQ